MDRNRQVLETIQRELLNRELARLESDNCTVLPGGHADVRSFFSYDREELDGNIELDPETHPRPDRSDTRTRFIRQNGTMELATVRMDDPDIIGAALTVRRHGRHTVRTCRRNEGSVFRRDAHGKLIAIA